MCISLEHVLVSGYHLQRVEINLKHLEFLQDQILSLEINPIFDIFKTATKPTSSS